MNNFGLKYSIMTYWGPRADTPEALAPRFLRTLDELSAIDPAFSRWLIGHERGIDLAPLSLAEVIKYIADGGEEGVPSEGYYFLATSRTKPRSRCFILDFHVGCTSQAELLINRVSIETLPLCEENTSLITLAVLKPALLVLASLWQPMWCNIGPWGLNDYKFRPDPPRPWFGPAWVTYLSPRFAPLVTPPPSVIAEHLPDGALLMIATEDRFDTDNPDHLAAALDIQSALAPINALPWPPDAEPEG